MPGGTCGSGDGVGKAGGGSCVPGIERPAGLPQLHHCTQAASSADPRPPEFPRCCVPADVCCGHPATVRVPSYPGSEGWASPRRDGRRAERRVWGRERPADPGKRPKGRRFTRELVASGVTVHRHPPLVCHRLLGRRVHLMITRPRSELPAEPHLTAGHQPHPRPRAPRNSRASKAVKTLPCTPQS